MDELSLSQGGKDQEQGVIGAVLKKGAIYEELKDILSPDDFGWISYREIWSAIGRVHESGMKIDALTVGDEIKRSGDFDGLQAHDGLADRSGRALMAWLRDHGEPQNAKSYAENVKDYSAKYKLLVKFQEGINHAANGRRAQDIISDMTTFMSGLSVGVGDGFEEGAAAVGRGVKDTEDASNGKTKVIPTGFIDLDRKMRGGGRGGRLYLVAAPPGEGKSAFLLNLINNASALGKRCGLLSQEMATGEQTNRLISMLSGIDSDRIEAGQFKDEEWPVYYHAVEVAESRNIYWDDTPSLTMSKLRSKARKMAEKGLDALFIDSLNLMDAQMPKAMPHEKINWLSYQIKTLSRELDVPIWLAHHMNRDAQRADAKKREPILADLEQSGDKAADFVMFIYTSADDMPGGNIRRFKIAKFRGGPAPSYFDLFFHGNVMKFDNAVSRALSV